MIRKDNMIPVSSSNLSAVGYDPATETLTIAFNDGGLYEYYNVPQRIYEGLMNSPSKGQYFHRFIRDSYYTTKLR